MKVFTHLRCFIFNAFNWNIWLAGFLLRDDLKGEKKYGINTAGLDELGGLEKNGVDITNNSIYTPVSFYLLEKTLSEIPVKYRNHFLDMGCGMGRAMCVAAHYGFKKVTGIDFSEPLCKTAIKNLSKTQQNISPFVCNIIYNDAFYYEIPKDVDCLFFFNPFNDIIMNGVVNNVMKSLEQTPRDLYVIYVNPIYKELWTDEGFTEIYHTQKLKYLEASILRRKK